jgi:hypothetical protein
VSPLPIPPENKPASSTPIKMVLNIQAMKEMDVKQHQGLKTFVILVSGKRNQNTEMNTNTIQD